jgi:hypothetical protein
LKSCCLQLYNLENLSFVNNWLNNARVGCKVHNNLVELIDFELDLEQELYEFEGSFK